MFKILVDFVQIMFDIGVFVNAALLIPQIIKLLQEKHAKDISLITFIGFTIINLFTALHGFIVQDIWLMIGYSCSVITSAIVSLLIVWYRIR